MLIFILLLNGIVLRVQTQPRKYKHFPPKGQFGKPKKGAHAQNSTITKTLPK